MIPLAFVLNGLVLISQTISVCPAGCAFSSLGQALVSAGERDTITVKAGTYREREPIVISKAVTIAGEGFPTFEGNGTDNVIVVKTASVEISGLQVVNSGASYIHELAGIRIEDSHSVVLRNNRLINNTYGVYLANSEGCTVQDNYIEGTGASESEAGNGIHSWSGRRHRFIDNVVLKHRDGLYLEFTDDSLISGNSVERNVRYGLHFMTSHRNEYRQNRFEQNGAGVAVMYSRNVKMYENVFADNRGVASYGLLLKDITSGRIEGNRFSDNTFGVYMEGTNRSVFQRNVFADNGYALRILGNCDDNVFEQNDFSGNTFDVATNSSRNPNRFTGNYWSSYTGYDLDSNGIGDVPFRPVSLSSILVEKVDSTFPLIKSPFFLVLDQAEQVFPMLIPESLKDERPLMRPYSPVLNGESHDIG